MKTNRIVSGIMGAGLLLCASLGFAATGADVGVVNQLSGDVSYSGEGGAAAKAQPYMKVRDGDRFTLASGASMRIMYFQSSRQESWKGPASFNAGAQQSEAISGKPDVVQVPSGVPQKIAQMPDLIQLAKTGGRTGGVELRKVQTLTPKQRASLEQQADIAAAKDTYYKLRSQLPNDDITPELYLLSALEEYLLWDEMKPVADEMLKRQPNNPDAQALADWIKSHNQPQ